MHRFQVTSYREPFFIVVQNQNRAVMAPRLTSTVWRFGPGLRSLHRAHSGSLGGLSFKWLGDWAWGAKAQRSSPILPANKEEGFVLASPQRPLAFPWLKSLKLKRKREAAAAQAPVMSDD